MPKTEVTGSQIKDGSVDLAADVAGVLPVANGGSGSNTIPLNNVVLGNGTGAVQTVAPGASGNVLTSNGSTWTSAAPTGGGGSGDVTLTGVQTLTNKTIQSPVINQIIDTNSAVIIDTSLRANAVNYIQFSNSATGSSPGIRSAGSDGSVGILVAPKGGGWVDLYMPTGTTTANLRGTGDEASVNLNLRTKGSGVVQANSVEVVTTSGNQNLTNKTLTTPKTSQINDSTGAAALIVSGGTNFFGVYGAADGATPTFAVNGTNDANVGLNLQPKGTGSVMVNNVPVVTTTGVQSISNKTLASTVVGQVADLSIVAFGANTTRVAGTGDFPFGVKLQRAVTFTSVTYRVATADASGNLVVELRKNGVAVSGSSATIAAGSQVAGGTASGTWSFASGDIVTVQVTGVGTTPGRGLIADIRGLTA